MPDEREDVERERARRVVIRRYKRRLKAAAALVLSVAAGTFLACQRESDKPGARPAPAPNPTTPEISNLPAAESGGGANETNSDRSSGGVASGTVESGGGPSSGAGGAGRRNQVDRHEHRKGMPVRDNLVE
ncbi:MAG TPA: hypothetical protein VFQ61_00860 [Polyangiaceae bacterium]|nr:hypothetical protein [Polyangiaceae bacterium]